MNRGEYLVPIPETLGTTALGTQWNQHIDVPMLKQEAEKDIDEEYLPGSDYNMLSQHVNYYDTETHVLDQVKEELFGYDYPQADCSTNNKIFSENNRLVSVKDKQKVENQNTKGSLDIKQEIEENIYELTIKLETDDQEEMVDNAEGTNIHCDASVTPQKAQSKLYSKNSSNLLQRYNEQINIEINTLEDNEMKELHQCQYCSEHFNNHNSMLAHISYVHRKKYPKCELCEKQFKTVQALKRHILKIHKLKLPMRVTRKNWTCKYCNISFKKRSTLNSHMKLCYPAKKITYKCGSCVKHFKSRYSLVVHMKRTHYNFGRMFKCWCGEQFYTPIHLSEHKSLQHAGKTKREEYKCKICDAVLNSQRYLTIHVQRSHPDYGRNTEEQLANHMIKRHDRLNDSTYKGKVQCDHCHRKFTNNSYLMTHIRRIHYDYGKVFKCWCGKEYRTPYHLKDHEGMHNYENTKVQCDTCKRFYKNDYSLFRHKIKMHSDYGKLYDCWCGKEFSTPAQLEDHKDQQHNSAAEEIDNYKVQCIKCKSYFNNPSSLQRHIIGTDHDYDNRVFVSWCGKEIHTPIEDNKDQQCNTTTDETHNNKVQCVICNAYLKHRASLMVHMRRIHHDYGDKVFACWCGKVFRTPYKLSRHKSMCHDSKSDRTLTSKVQCDVCQKFYKSNRLLERHCKRMHCDYLFE